MTLEQMFFELLQVAIGNRQGLTYMPKSRQWTELFEMAKKQSLVAVAFNGVTRLNVASDYGASLGIPEMTYLKWLGLVAKTQQKNREMNTLCAEVCKDFLHDGFRTMVLKGQSNLTCYPEELKECRTAGDIDVWVRPFEGIDIAVSSGNGAEYVNYTGKTAVVEYARQQARLLGKSEDLYIRFHHVDMPISAETEVEAHFMPMYFNNPFLNSRLQEFFERYGEPVGHRLTDGLTIPCGSASFNVIYQLTHIYKHLFEEGIGLRQLLDYYFVLRALHIEQGEFSDRTVSMGQWAEGMGMSVLSNEEVQHWLGRLGLKRLAGAVMYVQKVVFDLPSVYMICDPDDMTGKHLLEEIMLAGNFGKYDPRKGDLANESALHKFLRKTKRNLLLAKYYPHEALWEPSFRLYHFFWRKLALWRF